MIDRLAVHRVGVLGGRESDGLRVAPGNRVEGEHGPGGHTQVGVAAREGVGDHHGAGGLGVQADGVIGRAAFRHNQVGCGNYQALHIVVRDGHGGIAGGAEEVGQVRRQCHDHVFIRLDQEIVQGGQKDLGLAGSVRNRHRAGERDVVAARKGGARDEVIHHQAAEIAAHPADGERAGVEAGFRSGGIDLLGGALAQVEVYSKFLN